MNISELTESQWRLMNSALEKVYNDLDRLDRKNAYLDVKDNILHFPSKISDIDKSSLKICYITLWRNEFENKNGCNMLRFKAKVCKDDKQRSKLFFLHGLFKGSECIEGLIERKRIYEVFSLNIEDVPQSVCLI